MRFDECSILIDNQDEGDDDVKEEEGIHELINKEEEADVCLGDEGHLGVRRTREGEISHEHARGAGKVCVRGNGESSHEHARKARRLCAS